MFSVVFIGRFSSEIVSGVGNRVMWQGWGGRGLRIILKLTRTCVLNGIEPMPEGGGGGGGTLI